MQRIGLSQSNDRPDHPFKFKDNTLFTTLSNPKQLAK